MKFNTKLVSKSWYKYLPQFYCVKHAQYFYSACFLEHNGNLSWTYQRVIVSKEVVSVLSIKLTFQPVIHKALSISHILQFQIGYILVNICLAYKRIWIYNIQHTVNALSANSRVCTKTLNIFKRFTFVFASQICSNVSVKNNKAVYKSKGCSIDFSWTVC